MQNFTAFGGKEKVQKHQMKRTLTILVATVMAISALWNTHAQELTKGQVDANILREIEAILQHEQAEKAIAEREAALTTEQKEARALLAAERMLNIVTPPIPTNAVISAIRRVSASLSSNIKMSSTATISSLESSNYENGDGEMQTMSLIGGGQGGIDLPSFVTYGVAPLSSWNTDSISGLYYPWHQESSSYTTNPIIVSYSPWALPAYTSSRVWTLLTNHYDLNGNPRAHQLRIVYKFANSGGDSFKVRLGHPAGTTLATLPTTRASGLGLATNTIVVPSMSTNLDVYFIVFRNAAVSYNPQAYLYSVQWQAYSGPVQDALSIEKNSADTVKVSWNILNESSNHWHLEYADNILGPWASNSTPVSYNGWQAYVNFTNSYGLRLYRLGYH
jgi:hypothetical protein